MKKVKMIIITAVMAVAAILVGMSLVSPAFADVNCPVGSLRNGTAPTLAQCNVPEDTDASSPTNGKSLIEVVQIVINVILSILGLATVIIIIIGGVQYTTSAGDPTKVTKAKNTIMYGVIGLVIALLAFAIVNFVLKEVFNSAASPDGNEEPGTSETKTETETGAKVNK